MTDNTQSHVSPSRRLEGKLALITGCTGGIGNATAITLAQQGCSIAVHHHSASSKAEKLVNQLLEILGQSTASTSTSTSAQIKPRVAAFQADLENYDQVRKLHSDVVQTMGHPDILFNNAGVTGKPIGPMGNIEDVDIGVMESTWRINTGSGFLLTQLCIPYMLSQNYGRIIFCSSVAAGTGGVIGPHYASSKSALHGMIHWVANRYAKDGITCNGVAPALIERTEMMGNRPNPELLKRIPVGRFGTPEEIASIVETLILNAYMTNKIIVADGGWTGTGF